MSYSTCCQKHLIGLYRTCESNMYMYMYAMETIYFYDVTSDYFCQSEQRIMHLLAVYPRCFFAVIIAALLLCLVIYPVSAYSGVLL